MHATRCAGQGLLVRPTESELWETLDLPASQAGGGNTWMSPRIEGGPSTRHAHEQIVIFLPRCPLSFFGVFLFWRPQSGARPACAMHAARYRAHRSTGFTARFQPIDRGNRELGDHGKAQTLAGDWAVRSRSSAGLFVGLVLWRRARRIARECAVQACVRDGMIWCAMGGDVKQAISNGLGGVCHCRDPGDSRQQLGNWRCSLVTGLVRPPVRPSAVLVVAAEATGHVTDGEGSRSTARTAVHIASRVPQQAKPDQSSDRNMAAGSLFSSVAGESSSLASPVGHP